MEHPASHSGEAPDDQCLAGLTPPDLSHAAATTAVTDRSGQDDAHSLLVSAASVSGYSKDHKNIYSLYVISNRYLFQHNYIIELIKLREGKMGLSIDIHRYTDY